MTATELLEQKTATVEDVVDESDSGSEGEESPEMLAGGDVSKMSRGEKKARKALAKLGLKAVPGVHRVTIKRPKNVSGRVNFWKNTKIFCRFFL